MSLRELSKPFLDSFGLIQPSNHTTGNGVRYTSDFICIARKRMAEEPAKYIADDFLFINELLDSLRDCEMSGSPGLLCRYPGNITEQDSFDDYIGYISASKEFAGRFLRYGREHRNASGIGFVFNNVNQDQFSIESFLGRNQALIAHAQFASGESPSWWRVIIWTVSVGLGCWRKGQDEKILTWHLLKTAKESDNPPLFINDLVNYFKWMMSIQFKDGLGALLIEYFGHWHITGYLFGNRYF